MSRLPTVVDRHWSAGRSPFFGPIVLIGDHDATRVCLKNLARCRKKGTMSAHEHERPALLVTVCMFVRESNSYEACA